MNISKYWNQGINYDQYIIDITQLLESNKEHEHYDHYDINLKRMDRITRTLSKDTIISEGEKEQIKGKKLLIITEGWCGDAAQIIPIVQRYFGDIMEIKYIYRDAYPDLMDHFLTNGNKSIPIVLILDQEDNVINHWGPRPKYMDAYLLKYKSDPLSYPKEQFINDIQIAYNKDKGVKIIEEIKAIFK